jgi:protein gp37
MELNEDILLIIYSYGGPNTIFLNKKFKNYIDKLKNEFISEPLRLKYRLIRWKSKFYNDIIGRPSMLIENYDNLEIKGNIYLGKLLDDNKTIEFSKQFQNFIIPVSKMELSNSAYKGNVIYWEVNNLILIDSKYRFENYSLLWNNYI